MNESQTILSVNAVAKRLRIGYTKAKLLIENGLIESVNYLGKYRVPEFKLQVYLNQKNSLINKDRIQYEGSTDDELRILSIISNLRGNDNGITL